MKKRLKNWITSVIGAVMMVFAIVMYVMNHFYNFDIPGVEIAAIALLGWVFLTARDTLLEGIFLNIFKIKNDGKDSEE